MKRILLAVLAGLFAISALALELSNPIIQGGLMGGVQQSSPNYGLTPLVTTSTAYTVTSTDETIIFNAGGGVTITLPSSAANVGRRLRILTVANQTVTSASSNVIPCTSTSAGTAVLAGTAGKWIELVADGVVGTSNWRCIAAN